MRGSSFTWLSAGSCLSSSSLQGSQKILVRSEIIKCTSITKYLDIKILRNISLHKRSPERPDTTVIPKFLRSFGRRRGRFVFFIFINRVFFFHLVFFGCLFYRLRRRWLCLERERRKKEIYFVYDWDIEFISILFSFTPCVLSYNALI